MKKEMSDNEIVIRIRAGDNFLFEELNNRYRKKLISYARRLGTGDDAEDVVQNTFLKVFVNLEKFKDEFKFNSWIFRICHNEALSHWRKCGKKNNETISLDQVLRKSEEHGEICWLDLIESDEIGPAAECHRNDKIKAVKEAINLLPEKQRYILIDLVYYNMSAKEISEKRGIPIPTVGTLASRARYQLSKFKMLRQLA